MVDGTKVPTPENGYNPITHPEAYAFPELCYLREMVVSHTGLEIGAVIELDYTLTSKPGFQPFLEGRGGFWRHAAGPGSHRGRHGAEGGGPRLVRHRQPAQAARQAGRGRRPVRVARGQPAGVSRGAAVSRPLPGRADALFHHRQVLEGAPGQAAGGDPGRCRGRGGAGRPGRGAAVHGAAAEGRGPRGRRRAQSEPGAGRPRRGRGGVPARSTNAATAPAWRRPSTSRPCSRPRVQGCPARRPAARGQRLFQGCLPAGGEGVAGPRARSGLRRPGRTRKATWPSRAIPAPCLVRDARTGELLSKPDARPARFVLPVPRQGLGRRALQAGGHPGAGRPPLQGGADGRGRRQGGRKDGGRPAPRLGRRKDPGEGARRGRAGAVLLLHGGDRRPVPLHGRFPVLRGAGPAGGGGLARPLPRARPADRRSSCRWRRSASGWT